MAIEDFDQVTIAPAKLRPFSKFIMSIGELPTSYLDSLSYAEQVTWFCDYLQNNVIPALNNNAAALEEVQGLVTELQEYVNNYFTDLDVTEEINNKLDSMAEDGTLYNIIRVYTNPIVEAQNNRIDDIETMVEAATSGSPLTASSTAGMTDTSKVYVNTTDGYWYYYNGSTWTQGGVYQGVNLSNKSVHYNNLDDELQGSIESVSDPTTITSVYDGLVNTNGTITTSTILQYFEFSVQPFDTYKLHINYSTSTYSNDNVAIQLLNDNSVVSNLLKTDVTIVDDYYTKVITIPYGVNKMRINTHKRATASYMGNYILKVEKYEIDNITKRQLDSTLQSFFKNQYEEITPTTFCPQSFFTLSTYTEYATTEILSVNVQPHEVYRINAVQVDKNPLLGFLTNNTIVTKTLNGNDYTFNNFVECIRNDETRHVYEDYVFEIPEYCDKIYINHWTNSNDTIFKLEKCTSYKINESDIIDDTNKIGFTKLIAVGDSITEVNYRALTNYLGWIKNDIPTLTIQNLGASGTGYMRTANTFITRLDSINTYDLDNDVIIVMGSVNDMEFVENQLGSLGDTTTATLYGSMYQFFNTLFTKFNGVRVGCISPINWRYATGAENKLNLYINALKETCDLFKVPFLDIHKETNLRPENETFRNTYYEADGVGNEGQIDSTGVHPNSAGHKLFYGRIKEFISKL